MARVMILRFRITERAATKFWAHRITREQVVSMLQNRWITTRNRKSQVSDYLLIGRDDSGRCITVPIMATEDPMVWRPITAWYCKPSEAAKLR
jgi:hypothetical protein